MHFSWLVGAGVVLAMAACAGLFIQARSRIDRIWTGLMLASFPLVAVLWGWLPPGSPRQWLPWAWLALIVGAALGLMVRSSRNGVFPPAPTDREEGAMTPMTTQEALQGPAGTRRALALYFGLLLLSAMVMVALVLLAARGPGY